MAAAMVVDTTATVTMAPTANTTGLPTAATIVGWLDWSLASRAATVYQPCWGWGWVSGVKVGVSGYIKDDLAIRIKDDLPIRIKE